MKTIVSVLICNLALISFVWGAQKDENKANKKKQAQTVQHAAQPAQHLPRAQATGKKSTPVASRQQNPRTPQRPTAGHQIQNRNRSQASTTADVHKRKKTQNAVESGNNRKRNEREVSTGGRDRDNAKKAGRSVAQGKNGKNNQPNVGRKTTNGSRSNEVTRKGKTNETTRTVASKGKVATSKPFKPQHFKVAKQPNTAKAPSVKFQQGRRLQGSQKWHGQQYSVFRNYKEEWHDRNWWHQHHNRIVFVFGAPYYWNAGYWYPAWGYDTNAYYAWSGPIYAYHNLPPDQVIANVQAALQAQGYYRGEIDGIIGPLTRGAIADYQSDRGLYITSAIDQPTLRSLGMA